MEMEMEKESLNQLLENSSKIDLTLSYSKLSDFDRNGAMSLIRRNVIEGAGVKHGSLVDDLLVDNMTGNNLCEAKYYKFDGEKPSATLGSLCDIVLKNYLTIPEKVEDVLEIVKLNKFWSNIKNENTLIEKFNIPEFWDYINAMYEVGDKILITTEEYMDAIEMVSILKSHKYSKDIIINEYENIYQHKFEIEYKGFIVRGILDLISIDHKNKIVYFTDLKTGKNPAIEFEDSFIKWRYYFQGAIYILASEQILRGLGIREYKIQDFQFLYISKSDKTPLLYKMTRKWISAAMNGFSINRYVYKGINELIDEVRWCWDNKEYLVPKYIVDNNGVVNIKDNFIEVNEQNKV